MAGRRVLIDVAVCIVFQLIILFGLLPFGWKLSGDLIGQIGFSSEYEVNNMRHIILLDEWIPSAPLSLPPSFPPFLPPSLFPSLFPSVPPSLSLSGSPNYRVHSIATSLLHGHRAALGCLRRLCPRRTSWIQQTGKTNTHF